MALLQNEFYTQISLATIKKLSKKQPYKTKLEFWECDVIFNMNKSDFSFNVIQPTQNFALYSDNCDLSTFDIEVTKDRLRLKRFWTKEEAELFILFNITQIYKPLKHYVDEHNIEEQFNDLIDKHPDKILKELESGKSWLTN